MAAADEHSGPPEEKTSRAVAGRYELERELARGGMGVVWIATDTKLDRKVALKILVATETDDAVARFEREAKTVAALRSDHVVQVHDYGAEDGVPFIVMELLEGESLGDRLRREGSLTLDECAVLLMQIARGLRAAHDADLVHRDLKPSNIFLARRDDGVVVKLLDFGVVKAADRKHGTESTASGVVLGTPQYMSPEQARGIRQVDHRADLWSLGVILLRAITGQNPFSSDSVGDAVIKICIEPIPRASDLVQVPEELDTFFAKALARDPDERFESADALAQAFLEAVGRVDLNTSTLGEVPRRGQRVADGGPSSVTAASRRFGPGPPGSATAGASGSRSEAARTPPSATIGTTLATSIVRPAARRRPVWFAGAGGVAVVVGGIVAFSLLRKPPVSAADAAASAVTSSAGSVGATASGAGADSSGSAARAPASASGAGGGGPTIGSSDAGAAPASTSAAGVVAGSAPSAVGTPGPGGVSPPPTGAQGSPPGGVWVPSEGKQNSGKDAPKWY